MHENCLACNTGRPTKRLYEVSYRLLVFILANPKILGQGLSSFHMTVLLLLWWCCCCLVLVVVVEKARHSILKLCGMTFAEYVVTCMRRCLL